MKNIVSDLSAPNRSEEQIRSRERVSAHGEVFTADREVEAMLDLVCRETERIDSRFLEPACGNGNFLVKILERKLTVVRHKYIKNRTDYELYALIAVSSIYGIDIQMDNVIECRDRLYEILAVEYVTTFKEQFREKYLLAIRHILSKNIIWGDSLTQQAPDGLAPIRFCEWSVVNDKIIRRDFLLEDLLQNQPFEGSNLFYDLGDEAFIPTPIAVYPPIHYLKLADYGTK